MICRLLLPAALLASAAIAGAACWETELVDGGGAGKSTSLKIDKNGNVHVVYVVENDDNALRYAFWDRQIGKWFKMEVARSAANTALALDSKQYPHISYNDFGSGFGAKLRHAYWDGAGWKKEAIPLSSEVVAYQTSIVLDSQDRPTLSFYEYRGPRGTDISIRMRTVSWTGKFWEVRTVDSMGGSGKFNALAVDSQDRIHLAYANVAEVSQRYAFWGGESWQAEVLEGGHKTRTSMGYSTAIAVDKEGNPHLAYMDMDTPGLRYAFRKDGRWQFQLVDRVRHVAYPDRNSIVVDEAGTPYIAYYDAGIGTLKVAFRHGSQWATTVVDTSGGFTPSLDVKDGELWVSYADDVRGGLGVARVDIRAAVGAQDGDASCSGKGLR